jgi:hypothetical protein
MSLRRRLATFCVRLAMLLIAMGVLFLLPEPYNDDMLHFKNAAVALFGVILTGKLLFDTLFYDRYGR